jgi:hypothetical protein
MSPLGRKYQLSFVGSGRSNRKGRLRFHQFATDRCGRGADFHDDVADHLKWVESRR